MGLRWYCSARWGKGKSNCKLIVPPSDELKKSFRPRAHLLPFLRVYTHSHVHLNALLRVCTCTGTYCISKVSLYVVLKHTCMYKFVYLRIGYNDYVCIIYLTPCIITFLHLLQLPRFRR